MLREQTRTTNLLSHVGELGGCLDCVWHQILIKNVKDDDDNWLNLQQCEFNITSGTGSCPLQLETQLHNIIRCKGATG